MNTTNPGLTSAKPIPLEFSVSLLFRQQFDIKTEQVFRQSYGLLEYLRNVPQYAPELYQIYKYSRVTRVKYHFDTVNLGPRPYEIMGVVLPADEASAASVA